MKPHFLSKIWDLLPTVLCSIGVLITVTLLLSERVGVPPFCGAESPCARVAADSWSHLGPVPVSAIGLVGYLALVGSLIRRRSGAETSPNLAYALAAVGAAVSAVLTYHAVFTLHAVCPWCLASAIVMGALLVLLAFGSGSRGASPAGALGLVLTAGAGGMLLSRLANPDPLTELRKNLAAVHVSEIAGTRHDALLSGSDRTVPIFVMFGDFECPACRDLFARLSRLHHEQKPFRLVFRHFPLPKHELGRALAIVCETNSNENQRWQFIFWAMSQPEPPSVAQAENWVAKRGVARSQVRRALENGIEASPVVFDDVREGQRLGVSITPTLLQLHKDRITLADPREINRLIP